MCGNKLKSSLGAAVVGAIAVAIALSASGLVDGKANTGGDAGVGKKGDLLVSAVYEKCTAEVCADSDFGGYVTSVKRNLEDFRRISV